MIEYQVISRSVEVSEVLGYTAQVLQYRDNVGENVSTPWMDVCEVNGPSPKESRDSTIATITAENDRLKSRGIEDMKFEIGTLKAENAALRTEGKAVAEKLLATEEARVHFANIARIRAKQNSDYRGKLEALKQAARAVVIRHSKIIHNGELSYIEYESENLENLVAALLGDK